VLQRVKLPRYDKNYTPSSLLIADILTVIDSHRIDGRNITIELYDKEGKTQVHAEMNHAIYNQLNSTLVANEKITIKGDDFQASGTGLVYHWHTNQGFLLGPATSQFIINRQSPSSAMLQKPSPTSLSLAGALISLTTTLIAEPPSRLTPTQLTELDTLTQPRTEIIQRNQRETDTILNEENSLIGKTNATMHPFLKTIGQAALLVQTEEPTSQPQKKATPEDSSPPLKKSSQPTKKNDTPPTPPQLLLVECDGGIYFDSDSGVLAYLKNIRLTDTRFKLNCSDELKVILDQKPAKPDPSKKSTSPAKKNTAKETKNTNTSHSPQPTNPADLANKKENSPTAAFGDVKRIIAIGQVKMISKDENGKTFIATAETASYDAKTGEMILRGGLPRIQYGPNQYLQSKAPGQYIRMLKNGKLVTTGKWAMQIDTNQKKNTP
jgi:lipopolysaccharide export system protein LptA